MKPNFIPIMFAAGLLLAATPCGWAISPRQHLVSGVIVMVNRQARTLTVATAKDAKPLVFIWNDSTHFKHRGHPVCNGALEPGQPVTLRYRREPGRLVPREIKLRRDIATRCESGGCCALDRGNQDADNAGTFSRLAHAPQESWDARQSAADPEEPRRSNMTGIRKQKACL